MAWFAATGGIRSSWRSDPRYRALSAEERKEHDEYMEKEERKLFYGALLFLFFGFPLILGATGGVLYLIFILFA